jgi:hypothetical protein
MPRPKSHLGGLEEVPLLSLLVHFKATIHLQLLLCSPSLLALAINLHFFLR